MAKNEVANRLLKETEKILPHFLEFMVDRIINHQASLFLGAGISINSDYPSWYNLLKPCAEDLNIDIDKENDLYAIAQYFANKHNDAELRRMVSSKINLILPTNVLLNNLLDINFTSIWTTNFDNLIERCLQSRSILHNVIVNDKDLSSIDTTDKVNVYKINGDISNPTNMVLTKDDYERYVSNHALYLTFLKKELVANSFLFVGYSFTDSIILDCLSAINNYLGNYGSPHYAIMLIDNSVEPRFEYFVEDLEKRYNVKCLFALKDDIPLIISLLNAKIRDKKVFISGSYDTVSNDIATFADRLSYELVRALFESNYRISTGIGKKLGTFITGYAHQYLAERNIKDTSKYLSMRPFPFHLEINKSTQERYREIMQYDCSSAIFLFGQSHNSVINNSKNIQHISEGVYQEFQVAKKLNLKIIPVGSTGFEAEIIWKEVKENINRYYYLSKYMDVLKNEKDPKKISKVIITILNSISENGCIQ